MSHINHRRKNKRKLPDGKLHNGYRPTEDWQYIDKSLHYWPGIAELAGKRIYHETIGNDFTNGHRGMAKSVKGAKKFVRSRIRFHENTATRKFIQESRG